MASRNVIIFGPTGAVGSAAARTAEEMGAMVVLAMRDTKKSIPGLDTNKEEQGSFKRVYADLTKPETVREAVSTTRAKYAFMYNARGTADNMKSTIEVLKSAGIDLVVFLSSQSVRGDLTAIQPKQVIPYIHAQVEINLGKIFGTDGFVAIRPGYFASNTLQYKADLERGKVKIYMPDSKIDCIVPEDIGRVCDLMSQVDCVRILAKALGKNPEIQIVDEQGAYTMFVEERGLPALMAESFIAQAGKRIPGRNQIFGYPVSEEDLSNVQKYSGRKGKTFEEWVEQNKGKFL